MSFLHPEFLYFMMLPLLILFSLLLTQKHSYEHFFSDEVREKLRVNSGAMSLRTRNVLFLFIGLLLIVALAEPVIKDKEVEIKAKSADVILALDISDSMLAQDLYPSRLRVAKEKALSFLQRSSEQRVGVLAFAKGSYLVSPLSFDSAAVRFLLQKLDTNSITEQGTDLLALLEVLQKSIPQKKEKYLLILTDGGDAEDFSKEISYAKEHNIVVFIVAVATQKGAPIKLEDGSFVQYKGETVVSKRNDAIADLATSTGGVYIQSTRTDEDMQRMMQEIQSVANLEELKSQKVQQYIQLFYYPVGLAVFLLLLATSSMSKREVVHIPHALVFMLVFMNPLQSEAGVLDFMQLGEAKEAYEKQAYEKAARLYTEYADAHENAQSHFNAANAFYKNKEYQKAIEHYEKADFQSKEMQSKKYANMGNSYAKQGTAESLSKAVEIYEKSLKLHEDSQTQENLERVKELLKEQEKEQEKQQDQDQNQDQGKNEDQKPQEEQGGDSQQDQEPSKEQGQDQKEGQDPSQEEKQNGDEQQNGDEKQEESNDAEIKEPQEKDAEAKKDSKEQAQSVTATEPLQMSDAEQKKWLDALNRESHSYMYRLSEPTQQELDSDEKPW